MSKMQSSATTAEKGLVATSSATYNIILAFLALFTAIGVAAGIHAFFIGHDHAYGVTREVPWGLLIATYIFFVVTSTGLCLVSSIGHVFGVETLVPIAKRSIFLSIATIVSGFLVIGFEIENPWRMAIYNVISPNLTSNIWWMGTLYGAYLFFMLIEFALLQIGKHREAGMAGLLGVISGVAAHSNLGAVFGLLGGREFWHGPYMPIYFIASAMLSGCAAILFFTYLAYKANGWKMSESLERALSVTGKIGLLLIAVLAFFDTWKILSGIAGHPPGKYEATMALISGPYAVNFWIGEIGLGLVAPFILILAARMRNTKIMFVAGLLSIIGIFFMRYDLVVVGQIVPHYHGMDIVGLPTFYSYSPSLHEILITVGGLSLCGMLFLMGERLFRGHVSEAHS
ncbi:Polysulfide reductase, membrane subunit NrfD subunit [Dissulfuribacter thermophilus]|uniref:Polysulfide reductase, membrane subunit NrfD subunit n=1 Tax=Dissulfuribacter thermophilus TaxID=1156395 RepID=A0A1B9F9E9_9BACT|nr:NrfD/PsrC family molybdoenzyme membrane anchor subunit [Dissulfuribacter thermophilus]OCC16538.1 Polysulfide reductase, membrane subunit NrfD subunit [Dissulfuribacter thermophilus]